MEVIVDVSHGVRCGVLEFPVSSPVHGFPEVSCGVCCEAWFSALCPVSTGYCDVF